MSKEKVRRPYLLELHNILVTQYYIIWSPIQNLSCGAKLRRWIIKLDSQ